MSAVKAVTAAQLAMAAGGEHTVSYAISYPTPPSHLYAVAPPPQESRIKNQELRADDRLDDAIEACRTTALDMHSHCTLLFFRRYFTDR